MTTQTDMRMTEPQLCHYGVTIPVDWQPTCLQCGGYMYILLQSDEAYWMCPECIGSAERMMPSIAAAVGWEYAIPFNPTHPYSGRYVGS